MMKPTVSTIILLFLFFITLSPHQSGDLFWHLEHGRKIVDEGIFLKKDIYSYTAFNSPWLAHSWLSETLFYLFYKKAGVPGLSLIFSLLILLIASTAILNTVNSRPVSFFSWWFLVLLAGWHLGIIIHLRPYLFTVLGSWFFYKTLIKVLRQNTLSLKTSILLVFITILWVNLHAGALFSCVFIGFAGICALAEKKYRLFSSLLFTGISCAAALAFSPAHIKFYSYVLQYLGNSYHKKYIIEWFSPNFHNFKLFELYILVFILAFGIIPKKNRIFQSLCSLIFLHFALQSVRNIFMFIIVSLPIVCDYFVLLRYTFRTIPKPLKYIEKKFSILTIAARRNYDYLAFLVCIVFFIWYIPMQNKPWFWLNRICFEKNIFPPELAEFLKTPNCAPVFNDYFLGGYISFMTPQKVFIDGRADMYGKELLEEYIQISRCEEGYEKTLEKWNIKTVVINKNAILAKVFSVHPQWNKKASPGNYFIFQTASK